MNGPLVPWGWSITDSGATSKSRVQSFDNDFTVLKCSSLHRTFTSPEIPPVNYPEGFQGNEIPVDGTLVARICLERLSLVDEADD